MENPKYSFLNELVLLAPGNKGTVPQYDIISMETNFKRVSSILVKYYLTLNYNFKFTWIIFYDFSICYCRGSGFQIEQVAFCCIYSISSTGCSSIQITISPTVFIFKIRTWLYFFVFPAFINSSSNTITACVITIYGAN